LACSAEERRLRVALAADIRARRLTGMDAATAWRTQVKAYDSYDPAKAATLWRLFVQQGTWHVPTLVPKRAWGSLSPPDLIAGPRLAALPDLVRERWKVQRVPGGVRLPGLELTVTAADLVEHRRQFRKDLEVVQAMHRAGVKLLAGTDTPSPYAFPG